MPPAAVVARAAERGVQALALTDHDGVSGLAEAHIAADAAGIRLIDGVEVSVSWREHTIHVVGLAIDPQSDVLSEGLRANRSGRNGRAEQIAAQLAAVGIHGTLEGARAYVTNPELVSRTHFARYLVDSGYARSIQAVFERFLGEGKPGYVPHLWTTLDTAIAWILAAGGIPVLAHPGRYKLDEKGRKSLLESFRDRGGLGVEVVTGSHSPDEYGYWGKRANEYGLLASMGSDFHGPRETYKDLGELPPLPSSCVPVWTRL